MTNKKSAVYPLSSRQQETDLEPVVLESSAGIILRCGDSTVCLLPNGELQLNGQRIKIEANQTMALQASQVRVNCEDDR